MAAAKTSRCVIDNLPEAQRERILDALLSGEKMADIARELGISRQAVSDYRRRVVKPAVKVARKLQESEPAQQHMQMTTLRDSNKVDTRKVASLTKQVVKASPFRDRLEALWGRTDRALDRAENAVRTVTDRETGELVAVGPDVAAIAPVLNQAHKNLELLGRVTGELVETPTVQMAIQIVVPAVAPAPASDADVITYAGAVEIGDRQR